MSTQSLLRNDLQPLEGSGDDHLRLCKNPQHRHNSILDNSSYKSLSNRRFLHTIHSTCENCPKTPLKLVARLFPILIHTALHAIQNRRRGWDHLRGKYCVYFSNNNRMRIFHDIISIIFHILAKIPRSKPKVTHVRAVLSYGQAIQCTPSHHIQNHSY